MTPSDRIAAAIQELSSGGPILCRVSYRTMWDMDDPGYVLKAYFEAYVLIDVEDSQGIDEVVVAEGKVYQMMHNAVDEHYLWTMSDNESSHFADIASFLNEMQDDTDTELYVYQRSFYLSNFDLKPEYQKQGFGRRIADAVLRSAGALDSPVFIFPAQKQVIPHERLTKWWLSLHPDMQYNEKYNCAWAQEYTIQKELIK